MENNEQLNKIQLKAEILTTLAKLQGNSDAEFVEKTLSVLDTQQDKAAILSILLKELSKTTQEKAILICYLLVRLCDKQALENGLWELLKKPNVNDFVKSVIVNLLKDLGNKVDYENYNDYFKNPDEVIDADTKNLLHVAIMNPEAQIDFMDFLTSLSANDKEILVNSLGEDYSEDALANILIPVFMHDPYSDLAETALNILGLTKSQLALHTLCEATEFLESDRLKLVKKNISALKISGVRQDDTEIFYRKVLAESRPYEAYASYPDGHGNQALIFSRERENESIQLVAVVINDKTGIVDCFGFNEISKFELSRIVERFYSGDKSVYINATVLKTLLVNAERLTRKINGKVPYEYICWANLLKDIPIEPVPIETILSMKYVQHEITDEILEAVYMEDIVQRWFLDKEVSDEFATWVDGLDTRFGQDDFNVNLDDEIDKNYNVIFSKNEKELWSKRILTSAYLFYLASENALGQIFYALYYDEFAKEKFFKNILRKSLYEYYVALKFKLKEQKETTNIFALRNQKKSTELTEKQLKSVIKLIEAKWVQNV